MAEAKTKILLEGALRRLVANQVLDKEAAIEAQLKSRAQKIPLFRYLVDNDIVPPDRLALAASREYGVPLLDVSAIQLSQIPLNLVEQELIEKHTVLPLWRRGQKLFLAVSDPTDSQALRDIGFHTNLSISPILVQQDALEDAINDAFQASNAVMDGLEDEGLADLDFEDEPTVEETDSSEEVDETPVVQLINKTLLDAFRKGASDIHFEPYENQYRIRFRIDGMLKTIVRPPPSWSPRIASRIKVMARLDIAEKRVPQDGRVKLNLSKTQAIDFRVSTCPTLFGEKIVMRILDSAAAKMGIDKLGYEEDQKALFLEAIKKPYGMVLVTGPTGSGKTVSLYTALNILNTDGINISTVEDPVEIRLPGVNQVQQNAKQGMTFAAALRSFLRQDPDIIMVGEIRDLETAEIAIKAAQTGHMVLSTLHTNSAPETISRLMNMGVAPFNITSAVSLVIAQRLARRLHDCKKPSEKPRDAFLAAGFPESDLDDLQAYDPEGCRKCNEGYKGRVGVYQVMPMTDSIRRIILAGGNALQIADQAKEDGILDLREAALLKVKNGLTSLEEALRITVE